MESAFTFSFSPIPQLSQYHSPSTRSKSLSPCSVKTLQYRVRKRVHEGKPSATNRSRVNSIVTTEPSNEGTLSLGFIQLRTHQHLQRNTTNAWYETSNHLTSTCDTNDKAKQCNSTRHVIKQCNSARHVIKLISGGIETKPSHSPPVKLYGQITKTIRGLSKSC